MHGDYRLGNLMVGPDGLSAVLDWELVHTGDPLEDLGWLCAKVWRFGSPLPAAGLGSREQLLDSYAAVAGWRPTAAQLHWWELYATVQWGLMCLVMADRHLSGAEPSVELAAIGRRACEQEFDVLLALDLAVPEVADASDRAPAGDASLYGRPSAAELVDAVRILLTDQVQPETAGRTAFHARVAANDRLGCADGEALSEAISGGTLDDRWDEVVALVKDSVRDRLLVANPRHLGAPA